MRSGITGRTRFDSCICGGRHCLAGNSLLHATRAELPFPVAETGRTVYLGTRQSTVRRMKEEPCPYLESSSGWANSRKHEFRMTGIPAATRNPEGADNSLRSGN